MALLAALTALIIGVVVDRQSGLESREQLRVQALDRLNAAATAYTIDGRTRFGSSVLDSRLPAQVVDALNTNSEVTWYDGSTMWAARYLESDKVIYVQLEDAAMRVRLASLRRSLIAAGLGGTALAALAGWFVASSLSWRLRQAAGGATAVAAGLPGRLEVDGLDEVGALSRAVQTMADALAQRLETEKSFTADVAHELRTPVTALVSSAELLDEGPASVLVRNQVERLRRLVEDLLEISRLESGSVEVQSHPESLAMLVTSIAGEERPGLQVKVSVQRDEQVLVEPRRFERVLGNLLNNVVTHGGGLADVVVDGSSVRVIDHGPGFPDAVLTSGPQRFRSGGRGSGLGLTIAERQMAAMGGVLACRVAEGGGAEVELRLPPAP